MFVYHEGVYYNVNAINYVKPRRNGDVIVSLNYQRQPLTISGDEADKLLKYLAFSEAGCLEPATLQVGTLIDDPKAVELPTQEPELPSQDPQ